MNPAPSFWQRLQDRVALVCFGGVRVRVLDARDEDGVCAAVGYGSATINRDGREALAARVRELKPTRPGVVDVRKRADGTVFVRVTGPLAEEGFEQRLRNVLVNKS